MGQVMDLRHVLFEPNLVGWRGLPFAVRDAINLKAPLAVYTQEIKDEAERIIAENHWDCHVILVEKKDV